MKMIFVKQSHSLLEHPLREGCLEEMTRKDFIT